MLFIFVLSLYSTVVTHNGEYTQSSLAPGLCTAWQLGWNYAVRLRGVEPRQVAALSGLPCCPLTLVQRPDWWPPRTQRTICYASRCPLPQPTGQCCHLPGFHTAQPHCALSTELSRSAESQSEARLSILTTMCKKRTVQAQDKNK